jgi:hypothetical protein
MYTIVVYMIGTGSFKLIDLIPNSIMRWLGASVQAFADQQDDPADNLVRNTMQGSQYIQQSLGKAHQSFINLMKRAGGPEGQS